MNMPRDSSSKRLGLHWQPDGIMPSEDGSIRVSYLVATLSSKHKIINADSYYLVAVLSEHAVNVTAEVESSHCSKKTMHCHTADATRRLSRTR